MSDTVRESWGSKAGFLLAAAGSAVGLGNIWRFTYIMGENGGGAFIAVYLLCIAAIGVPVFLAELAIGRHTKRNPVGAFEALRPGTFWKHVGALGVVAGFMILSFYSVVGGWVIYYLAQSVLGNVSALSSPEAAGVYFNGLTTSGGAGTMLHALFMLVTIAIVARGIRGGIEKVSKVLMPLLLAILVILIVRGLLLPGAGEGVRFLLWPDLTKLSPSVLLTAMGHAFFTLSLGMGAMITYGSYLGRDANLPRSSLDVAAIDTGIAIAAGFAIFPALFALGMEPGQGPGLIFVTLPVVFSQLAGGTVFATLFFLLVFMAAITSSISMLEVVAAYFIDERDWSRPKAAWVLGGMIFVLGLPSALATGPMAGMSIAGLLGGAAGQGALGNIGILNLNWFDLISHVVSDYMLPIGGLFVALFVGWVWEQRLARAEVTDGCPGFAWCGVWLNMLRYLAPLVIAQVLALGILAEFPAEHFPGVASFVAAVEPWLAVSAAVAALAAVALAVWRPQGEPA